MHLPNMNPFLLIFIILLHNQLTPHAGHTIVTQHFPTWVSDRFFETWALTCLFHDIGTTSNNRSATHLSFEFQGGFIALTKLQEFGAPVAQAESVAEAIIRHQDPGETGTVSRMVQLVQIATEFGTCKALFLSPMSP
jgi:cyanamide hydratase